MNDAATKTTVNSPASHFDQNNYVLLQSVLTPDFCEELTKHMFNLLEEGKLVKDDQCPLSEAIYGDPAFDGLLEKLADPVGQHINKRLIPTYTYARIYRPGEVLERHVDRPACEISGTMTLGFNAPKVWPIYVSMDPNDSDGSRVDIRQGDLLMFRGEELHHWRPTFKGEWQVQVFFHFVDADGPHGEKERYDGRPALGLNAHTKGKTAEELGLDEVPQVGKAVEQVQTIQYKGDKLPSEQSKTAVFPIFEGVMIPSWDLDLPGVLTVNKETHPQFSLTPEECAAIIEFANEDYADPGSVGTGSEGKINKEIRNVDLYRIPLTDRSKWIFDKISRIVSFANAEYYGYEIMGITHELQLLHYNQVGEQPSHYNWHMDVGPGTAATRKISVSIQLSDPSTYEGGELLFNTNGQEVFADDEQGVINMFPSYCMHKVGPMKGGERWALVIWVHGSQRFK